MQTSVIFDSIIILDHKNKSSEVLKGTCRLRFELFFLLWGTFLQKNQRNTRNYEDILRKSMVKFQL